MRNVIKDLVQNKYSLGSKVRDKLHTLFYNYGLNCSRHPYLLIAFAISLFGFCCYPIFGIQLFQNDFSQHFITEFDAFRYSNWYKPNVSPVNSNSTHHVNITRMERSFRDAPQWFQTDDPHAYVMQIIVQSAVIPWKENLIIMDAIRAPIAQVFSIVDIISNFQLKTDQHSTTTTLNDVCLQVAEPIMLKDESAFFYLPRYSCLALSPANVWNNDLDRFLRDPAIIKTIFDIKDTSSLESGSVKELLFGLSWIQTGIRKLYVRTRQRTINYAITLVFKEFHEEFIESLKRTLKKEFPGHPFKSSNRTTDKSNDESNEETVHLYFQNQKHLTEFLPLAACYSLALWMMYFFVRKIDFIRNKFILAIGALLTIIMSLLSAIGICFWLEFNPTLNGSDILPYLVLFLGFENVAVIIKSVASTQKNMDMPVRMATGLRDVGLSILKWFAGLLILFLLGFFTFIPLIADICLFAIVALISDLVLQFTFFAPILASNMIKRPEPPNPKGHKRNLSASRPINIIHSADGDSSTKVFTRPSAIPDQPDKLPKRLRLFFFFVFDFRIIHLVMGAAFIGWMLALSLSTGTLKLGAPGPNRVKLSDDHNQSAAAWTDRPANAKDKSLTFEKHKFSKNKFMFSHFLSSQHWSTLFWSYNISLSGKYITILPALQLSIPVEPEKAIQTRHPSEPDPQIFRQYLFTQNSQTDSIDDYDDELPYPPQLEIARWSKRSIVLLSGLALIPFAILVYLLILLFRCLCTRDYAHWRSSFWLFKKGKNDPANLEDLVTETLPVRFLAHNQEIEYLCANTSDGIVVTSDLLGNVKIWNILSFECKHFIQRSHCKAEPVSGRPNGPLSRDGQLVNSGSSSLGSETTRSSSPANETDADWMSNSDGDLNRSASNGLIHRSTSNSFFPTQATNQKSPNQSMNQEAGQSFNQPISPTTNQSNTHQSTTKSEQEKNENGSKSGFNFTQYYQKATFSSSFISKFVFNATRSNSFDKIHNNDDLTSHKSRPIVSALKFQPIWSMVRYGKHLFLGCSNGRFEVWNINKGFLSFSNESTEPDSGITVIAVFGEKLAIARLNGSLEIWQLGEKPGGPNDESSLPLNRSLPTSSCGLHEAIINMDYLTFQRLNTIQAHKQPITCLKMNDVYLITGGADHKVRVFEFGPLSCSSYLTLNGHFAGITCLEIDMIMRSVFSGCQSGQICVWTLDTGACTFNLEAHNGAIAEILVTSLYILSSSVDSKINIWDKFSGNLVNVINYQYSLCTKMVIMESNILVTANEDELHLWSINEAKKIKVVKISEDDKFWLVRNLALSQQSQQSAIVCDYGAHLVLIHFPKIKKFD